MIKKILGFSLYIVFLLIICEAFLWLVASFSASTKILLSNQYNAPRQFGPRLNPDFIEHDEWGYRNALIGKFGLRSRRVPDQVDIVALGDSLTYGINAPVEKTWPAQLAEETCKSVYNMGVGATGPPHYLGNLDKALALSPKLLIVGLYFGNDFSDSAHFVYRGKYIPENMLDWRQSYLDRNPNFQEFFKNKFPDDKRRYLERATILEPGFSKASDRGSRVHDIAIDDEDQAGVIGFLRENSKLYGFLRLAKTMVTNSVVRKGRHDSRTRADPQFWDELCDYAARTPGVVCYDSANVQTVLDTRNRVKDKLTLRAGLEITLDVLHKIQVRLHGKGTDYLVILIPTKEYIYTRALPGRFGGIDKTFVEIDNQEGQVRDQVKQELDAFGIPYLDLLPSLIGEVQKNRSIYPASSQSHPNAYGYGTIAQSVALYLRKLGQGHVGC